MNPKNSGLDFDLRSRSILFLVISLFWLGHWGGGSLYADDLESVPPIEVGEASLEGMPEPTEVHENFVTITEKDFE